MLKKKNNQYKKNWLLQKWTGREISNNTRLCSRKRNKQNSRSNKRWMRSEISIPSSSTAVSEKRLCAPFPNTWKTKWPVNNLRNKKFVILDLQQSTVMSFLTRWRGMILRITTSLVRVIVEQVWLILMVLGPQTIWIAISKESQIPSKCPKLRSRPSKKRVSSKTRGIVMI